MDQWPHDLALHNQLGKHGKQSWLYCVSLYILAQPITSTTSSGHLTMLDT